MAQTPDHINITIDQDALRKQVQAAIGEALNDASMKLRLAADALNPGFMEKAFEDNARYAVERERERVRTPSTPTGEPR
jgi:hypothetical protein